MSERANPWVLSAPAIVVYVTFLTVPLALVFLISFFNFDFYGGIQEAVTFKNYLAILTDGYYYEIYARTFGVAAAVTLACMVLGTAEAYVLSRMANPWKGLFLMVVLGPLLISVVVRTLGWALLFGSTGLISKALLALGLTSAPVSLMYSNLGVGIALVHVLVPFMVISVWASLQRVNPSTESAALSLGASQFTVIRRVIVPQVMPGILSGSIMVFAMAASAFATPAIIGGRRLKTVATAAYDEFLNTLDWPLGAALAMVLLVATVIVLLAANRMVERRYNAVFN
ncbi:binding-protein-dependent transport system inner membrane protein [Bordetella ansorpii]|uniref:Binding-protein-dependent transport system inner membrane protein n=1 Tax=Bordetella ansorpii TaxID=288768 RepID=A0A157KIF3_9BORD|nr:ABC transporter permease [Bordetella ansorpii]SAH83926.1 binding-protein-dependent transport system inner membrane protein [Bordetella ansorpii]